MRLCCASGGGHTLRSGDLEMILAESGEVVSDGGHSADVTKKERKIDTHNCANITH